MKLSFIEIDDVIKVYNPQSANAVSALRGVNLKIEHNELVSLIGLELHENFLSFKNDFN